MRQVARQRRCHGEPRRVSHGPLRSQRQKCRRLAVASSRRARVEWPAAICSSRFESGTVVMASSWRNGSNSRLNGTWGSSNSHESVRPVVRTRVCNTRRCGPLVSKVARHDGEIERAPRPARPAGKLFEGRAPGAQHAMRPFQVLGPNPPGLVVEERELRKFTRDGYLGPKRPRIAPAGIPGDGVAAPDNRLLFLGDELVQKPEPRQRLACGLAQGFRRARAEDSQAAPTRPRVHASAAASTSCGVTRGSSSRATAFRARHASRSLRQPPKAMAAARMIQTAVLGSRSQLRLAGFPSREDLRPARRLPFSTRLIHVLHWRQARPSGATIRFRFITPRAARAAEPAKAPAARPLPVHPPPASAVGVPAWCRERRRLLAPRPRAALR